MTLKKKVLIAYGTWFGSTTEISLEMSKVLKKEGLVTKVVNLCEIDSKEWPEIGSFDGVLIGSGIKVSEWTKEPLDFMRKNRDELNKDDKKFGMFVCSLMSIVNPEYAQKTYIEEMSKEIGVTADISISMPGVIDFSKAAKIGFFDKMAVESIAKGAAEGKGIKIDKKGKNDFRDWEQVRTFAKNFAGKVNGTQKKDKPKLKPKITEKEEPETE